MENPPENRRRPGGRPSQPSLPPDEPAPDVDALALVDAPAEPSRNARTWVWVKRQLSIASAVALLVGTIAGVGRAHTWLTHTPRFGARTIAVTGIDHTTRAELLAAAGIALGTNVLGIDTSETARAIETLPWVARASVSRRLPGSVTIAVEERRAVAVVSSDGLYLCADDGTIFKRVQPGDPIDMPVVTGVAREDFEHDPDGARENVRDALALLADVETSAVGQRARVEEVHRDRTGDLSIVLAGDGTYVWLGRGGYRARLARLSGVLGELAQRHLHAAEIHLESDRHPERATVRLPVASPPPRT